MSLALSLAVGRSWRLTAFSLLAASTGSAGGVLAGLQCIRAGRTLLGASLVVAIPLACIVLRSIAVRRIARGVLRIESDGLANWNPQNARSALPFAPDRWFIVAGCAWISGDAQGRRLHLLSGADTLGDADWVRLRRWMLWLERGGGARG